MDLHGVIEFPEVPSSVHGATLHVRLLDVSRTDAAANRVAGASVGGVSVVAEGQVIGFGLEIPELEVGHTYAIEAHLDLDGSGGVSVGDYRTMEHFDVSPTAPRLASNVVCRLVK